MRMIAGRIRPVARLPHAAVPQPDHEQHEAAAGREHPRDQCSPSILFLLRRAFRGRRRSRRRTSRPTVSATKPASASTSPPRRDRAVAVARPLQLRGGPEQADRRDHRREMDRRRAPARRAPLELIQSAKPVTAVGAATSSPPISASQAAGPSLSRRDAELPENHEAGGEHEHADRRVGQRRMCGMPGQPAQEPSDERMASIYQKTSI